MLELINISLTLNGKNNGKNEKVDILKNINLSLEDDQLYAFTGPNGGGKSSLAKIIMGILQPTTGKIIFNNEDITDLSINERAKLGIGYAFQHPPRFKGITVKKLLSLSAANKKNNKKHFYLLNVGLCPQEYLDREINNSLSGGEMKRIEIASLLNRNLKLAIYDEPEAGIDLWSFGQLLEIFRDIHQQRNMTTVIISHQERILNLTNEIILIADGQVKEKGDKDIILPMIADEISCKCRNTCSERNEVEIECY